MARHHNWNHRQQLLITRRVSGNSLAPELDDGQLIVAQQTRQLTAGDYVIVSFDGQESIKRINRHQGDIIYLLEDNDQATKSEWVHAKYIIAKVIWPLFRS